MRAATALLGVILSGLSPNKLTGKGSTSTRVGKDKREKVAREKPFGGFYYCIKNSYIMDSYHSSTTVY